MLNSNDNEREGTDGAGEGEMTFSGGIVAYIVVVILAVVAYLFYRWFRWAARG